MIGIPDATVWRQVDRIVASLASSPRLCAFLRHIVEAALRDSEAELKEAVVGVEVFGRAPGYDPKRDPIVRVEARRLRRRLEEYYAGIGRRDPLLLEIPTGGYAPRVTPRRAALNDDPSKRSVEVCLLFRDEDGESHDFADSLSADVARLLRRTSPVRVVRASVPGDEGPRDHQVTSARYVLEGRIRLARELLRIDLRLVSADGGERWSGRFDVRVAEARIARDAIVSAVIATLGMRRPIVPRSPIGMAGEAYSLWLRGRYWLPRSVERAAAFFERAIDVDPACAPAYAGLADCWSSRGIWGPESPERARRQVEACARRALDIEPGLADGHSAHAMVAHGFDWDNEACAAALARSLALEPDHAHASSRYGHAYHLSLGDWAHTFEWIEQASRLDPLSPQYAYDLAAASLWTRQYDRAVGEARKCLDLWPMHAKARVIIAAARAFQSRWQDALDVLDGIDALEPVRPMALVIRGCVHAGSGDPARAREVLAALDQLSVRRYVSHAFIGVLLAALDDREAALGALDESCRRREPGVRYVVASPFVDRLRGDERFTQILRRVGVGAAS